MSFIDLNALKLFKQQADEQNNTRFMQKYNFKIAGREHGVTVLYDETNNLFKAYGKYDGTGDQLDLIMVGIDGYFGVMINCNGVIPSQGYLIDGVLNDDGTEGYFGVGSDGNIYVGISPVANIKQGAYMPPCIYPNAPVDGNIATIDLSTLPTSSMITLKVGSAPTTYTSSGEGGNNCMWYMDASGNVTVENQSSGHLYATKVWATRPTNATSIDMRGIDTTYLTDMSVMFFACTKLTELNVSEFNTAHVTTMARAFSGLTLSSLDLSSFNTHNLTNTAQMFMLCSSLENIYIGENWDMANVTTSSLMFQACGRLPNYDGNVIDKTNAHAGTGGYLTLKS